MLWESLLVAQVSRDGQMTIAAEEYVLRGITRIYLTRQKCVAAELAATSNIETQPKC